MFVPKHRSSEKASSGESSMDATQAKNNFGRVMKRVTDSPWTPVFIERHGQRKAVVIGPEYFERLVRQARGTHEKHLDALREEFDLLRARMQTSKAKKAANALLAASPARLNRASKPRG
jgi:prevent-host-death family protein